MDNVKHRPGTALPWRSEAPMGGIRKAHADASHVYLRHKAADVMTRARDSHYIAHACNAYPALVAFVRSKAFYGNGDACALLKSIGELE